MKVLLLFVVGMYGVQCTFTEEELTSRWTSFKTKYGKTYPDSNEESFRKQIFTKNLERIEEHNKKYEQGLVTYTMGVNQFTDFTEEEMRPYVHGVLRPEEKKRNL